MSASLNWIAWNFADRLAELVALAGVVERHVEHRLGEAQRQRGDRDAADLERAEELAEAELGVTDEMVVGHPHVVEEQLARVEALPTDPPHLRPHREPGRVLLDDEAGELRARATIAGLGAGQQRDAERHVGAGVGDERLAAVDQPAAVLALGPGGDAAHVGAGVGLGQPERAEHATLGERAEPAFTLLVVAEQVQRHRADRDVGLERGGDRLVGLTELFERGDEPDGRHPDAAPLLGHEHAEQPELAHLAQQVGRAFGPFPRRRRTDGDLLRGELPAQVDQVPLRFGVARSPCPETIRPIGTNRNSAADVARAPIRTRRRFGAFSDGGRVR